jgi:hypothetical protein
MFKFLIALGICLIILGLYGLYSEKISNGQKLLLSKKSLSEEKALFGEKRLDEKEPYSKESHVEKERLDEIKPNERKPGQDIYEGDTFQEVLERTDTPPDEERIFKIIEQYQLGSYTLEEACELLDMKKGEVLLLKNIYKKSRG